MTGDHAAREKAARDEEARRRQLEIAASGFSHDEAEDVEEAPTPDEEIAEARRSGYQPDHTDTVAYAFPRRRRWARGPRR